MYSQNAYAYTEAVTLAICAMTGKETVMLKTVLIAVAICADLSKPSMMP